MTVEKLTPRKNPPGSWTLTLSDGTELCATVDLIADFSLFTGRELTEAEAGELKAAAKRMGAYRRAMQIAGARALSRRELIDRLVARGEELPDAERAADRLAALGVIDDAAYAGMVARHYAQTGYGDLRIKNEFYRRGVPKEHWEAALNDLPDRTEAAARFVEARLRGRAPDKKELQRAAQAAARRGFTWDEVRAALAEYNSGRDMDDDG